MAGCRAAFVLIVSIIGCTSLKSASPVSTTAGRPTLQTVPAIPPDTVSSSLYEKRNLTEDSRYAGFLMRDIVLVRFAASATRAERQTAVDAVEGIVVGGRRFDKDGDGLYLVKLPSDTSNNRLFAAVATLRRLATIRWAMPNNVYSGY
jgi:hypothetical protein